MTFQLMIDNVHYSVRREGTSAGGWRWRCGCSRQAAALPSHGNSPLSSILTCKEKINPS
jgi:hypothetical protein